MPYQTDTYRGLFRGLGEGNFTAGLAVQDLVEESGAPPAMVAESRGAVIIRWLDIWRFGRGGGIGGGSGRGGGGGIGGGSGSGGGLGSGSGSGSGLGLGLGSGSGLGLGSGRGSWNEIYPGGQMEVGKAYIVHCGDWHTFVGRVESQLGPLTYRLGSASKISDTNNGDNWHLIAAGDKRARDACTYHHHETPIVLPLSIAAIEWVGETPQEAITKPTSWRAKKIEVES